MIRNTNPTTYSLNLAAPGSVTVDAAKYSTFIFHLAANLTGVTVLNPVAGSQYTFVYQQDATGGRTFTFPTPTVWTDTAPGITVANYRTTVTMLYDGTNWNEVSRSGVSGTAATGTYTDGLAVGVNPAGTAAESLHLYDNINNQSKYLRVSSDTLQFLNNAFSAAVATLTDVGVFTAVGGLVASAGGASITGNSTVTGTLHVTAATTIDGNLVVNSLGTPGSVQIADGTITKQSGTGFNMNSTLTATALTSSGLLTVSSGGSAITGNSSITGTLNVTSTVTAGTGLTVSAGGAAITGASTVTGTLNVSSTLTAGGALTVSAGGAAITGTVNVTGKVMSKSTSGAFGLYVTDDGTIAPGIEFDPSTGLGTKNANIGVAAHTNDFLTGSALGDLCMQVSSGAVVRSNAALLAAQPYVKVLGNGQHANANTETYLSWSSIESGFTGMWNVANPTRIVAPVAGVYHFQSALWTTNQNDPGKGSTRIRYLWRKNGLIVTEVGAFCTAQNGFCPAGSPHALIPMAANDYVELTATGVDSALDINSGDFTHVWLAAYLVASQ